MKEGRGGNDEKVLSAKCGQGSEQVTTRNNRFHTSTEGTKFNWRGNTGKSRHYWDGCYWALCAHHVYTHTLHTLRIEVQIVDLCIRSRKTGVHAAVTTLKESNDLHCGRWVLEEKHVYLLFLPPVFAKKNSHFCWLLLQCWARKRPGEGKKMALITGKRGQWELVVTIGEPGQFIYMWYVFKLVFKRTICSFTSCSSLLKICQPDVLLKTETVLKSKSLQPASTEHSVSWWNLPTWNTFKLNL